MTNGRCFDSEGEGTVSAFTHTDMPASAPVSAPVSAFTQKLFEHIRREGNPPPDEFDAMRVIWNALHVLDEPAQKRVLKWVLDRYLIESSK